MALTRRAAGALPPPPPQQGLQAGLVGWRRGPTLYLAAVPFPSLHPPGPALWGDGARAKQTAVSRQDFLALYERCADSGLCMHLTHCHQAGCHDITISCRLSAPPSEANALSDVLHRRRRC
jgi:hypothetical protein